MVSGVARRPRGGFGPRLGFSILTAHSGGARRLCEGLRPSPPRPASGSCVRGLGLPSDRRAASRPHPGGETAADSSRKLDTDDRRPPRAERGPARTCPNNNMPGRDDPWFAFLPLQACGPGAVRGSRSVRLARPPGKWDWGDESVRALGIKECVRHRWFRAPNRGRNITGAINRRALRGPARGSTPNWRRGGHRRWAIGFHRMMWRDRFLGPGACFR